jgi:phage/plasmid-associated DNA primase
VQGRFTEPAACRQAMQEYRTDCDPVRAFLTELYESAPGSAVATKDVYGHYTRWCAENGFQPMNNRNFGKSLRSVYSGVETKKIGPRYQRSRIFVGIQRINEF